MTLLKSSTERARQGRRSSAHTCSREAQGSACLSGFSHLSLLCLTQGVANPVQPRGWVYVHVARSKGCNGWASRRCSLSGLLWDPPLFLLQQCSVTSLSVTFGASCPSQHFQARRSFPCCSRSHEDFVGHTCSGPRDEFLAQVQPAFITLFVS